MDGTKQFYTTGEFAKKANVSLRTIRYYDTQGILKPTAMSGSGYRLYTDADFARLQMILTLKYLGFSLEEIADICVKDADTDYIRRSLALQKSLIRKRIDGLKLVEEALSETAQLVESGEAVDWSRMLGLIHMINMEQALAAQYKNGNNLNIRIFLHQEYSVNPKGWFAWIFEQIPLAPGKRILEIGCGNGQLWKDRALPEGCQVVLSDVSGGMLKEAQEQIGEREGFSYQAFDCQTLPFEAQTIDVVVANHVMFYVKNREKAFAEIRRVLKDGGVFICSTYGKDHMKEISALAKEFDGRVALSEVNLYEVFGLENGEEQLRPYFADIERRTYEDELRVDKAEPLADYIMSCHGNQHEYLNAQYGKFQRFLSEKLKKKGYIRITKSAGMFYCRKACAKDAKKQIDKNMQ